MEYNIVYLKETDSTNLRAKEGAAEGMPDRSLFVAERQSQGRGRLGRRWTSEDAGNIYMSLLLRPEISPQKASMLTLVMALAVAEGIRKAADVNTQIKWPNDIILNKKKVCGILTEMQADVQKIHHIVIGVGINVNQETFPEEIGQIATSLSQVTGTQHSRKQLIMQVMEAFERYYAAFLETENLSGLLEEYNKKLVNRGREVMIHEPGNEYIAVAEGINPLGELIVTMQDGKRQNIYAGEVSVRGIYGYT